MVESVNIKLKLDAADLQMLGGRGPSGGGVGFGGIVGGVAGGMTVFHGIKSGIDKLVQSSPALQGTILMFQKSLELLLRPIGDIMAMYIRPMAIKLLRLTATDEGRKKIFVTLGLAAGGVLGIAGIASLLGLGTTAIAGGAAGGAAAGAGAVAGATGLLVPFVLSASAILIGGLVASLTGGGINAKNVVTGMIASALGLGVTILAGGGFALGIPVALVASGIVGLANLRNELTEQGMTFKTADPIGDIGRGLVTKLLIKWFGKDIPESMEETANASKQMADQVVSDEAIMMTGAEALNRALNEIPDYQKKVVEFQTIHTTVGGGAVSGGPTPVSGGIPLSGQPGYERFRWLASNAKAGATAGSIVKKWQSEKAMGAFDL